MLACFTPSGSISKLCYTSHCPVNAKMTAETFPVLYNDRYGGFSFSKQAIQEYNKRLPAGSTLLDESSYEHDLSRDDPLMVQVIKELGPEANGKYAKIAMEEVPIKFKKHFLIGEYDGLENVQIDFQGYQMDKIRGILKDDSLSNEAKVQMTQHALDEVEYEDETQNGF